jgi:hypothetical protein
MYVKLLMSTAIYTTSVNGYNPDMAEPPDRRAQLMLSKAQVRAIEERRRQPDLPSRSEAMRRGSVCSIALPDFTLCRFFRG